MFRSDLHNGPRGTITRISVGWDGGDTSSTSSRTSDDPAISSTGRYVAFFSSADNVVAGDPGSGVFFRDMGEKDAPVLGPSSKGAVDWFSPNADGVEDTWTEQMGVSDASPPISWTLTFSDSNGIVVRTISGSTSQASATASATWDGTRDNGTALPDGLYSWSFQATDNWGNPSAPWNGSVGIDRSPPA